MVESFGQVIGDIAITGNQRTRTKTINNLLPFSIGDSLEAKDTSDLFSKTEILLYNTKLFVRVRVSGALVSSRWQVTILLTERWYTYITPHFDLIDRNINEWWVVRNHQLNRVNYGFDLTQKNATGRRDDFTWSLLNGHQQKATIEYELQNAFWNHKLGFYIGAEFRRYRNTNYTTIENELAYLRTEEHNYESRKGILGILYQPNFDLKASLNIGYGREQIADTIFRLNPGFFREGLTDLNHFQINPTLRFDQRDVRGYARSGYLIDIQASYFHFPGTTDINFVELLGRWVNHIPISHHFDIASSSGFKLSQGKHRPYFLNRALGWNVNSLRGYDLFVVDGNAFFYQKTSLRYKVYDRMLKTGRWLPRQFRKLPLKVIPKAFVDYGYVSNRTFQNQGNLLNESLVSTGIGLDFVLFDDAVWRIEYVTTNMAGNGVYLNFTSAIQ